MNEYSSLPEIRKQNIKLPHFPSPLVAFVFRMWEMIPADRMAKVLGTSAENVEKLAGKMGLKPQKHLENWISKGYITIIKNCWHILPYEQLLTLLDWDADTLAYTLREDDFLCGKLGDFKPDCEKVVWRALTENEKAEIEKICSIIGTLQENCAETKEAEPFDFYQKRYPSIKAETADRSVFTIEVTDKWTVDCREKEAKYFVEMFIEEIKEEWGVRLQMGAGERCIQINCNLTHVEEEYHEIAISENNIQISTSSPIGVLRALTYLEDLAKTAGGLYFKKKTYKRTPKFGTRFIYSYSGLYGNMLDEDIELSYPDELLYKYAKLGVNGIWGQGILYRLSEFPYDPSLSEGFEMRRERLRQLVQKTKKFGIKVYFYLNEPRSMPEKFFEKYPEIRGHADVRFFIGQVAMCTSHPDVQTYLKNAVQSLCEAVPDIGGFFTITSSENLTNCYSRVLDKETNCPVCKERLTADIISEINNKIAEGAHAVNPKIRVIAWTWGWVGRNMDFAETAKCVEKTDKSITIMCTSEEAKAYTVGGCSGNVRDYSMSIIGPGERSQSVWKAAREKGYRIGAKVQVNCTWECSSVPFIPVQGNVQKHMENLSQEGVRDILLSWTVGGYPSDNLKLISSFFFDNNEDVDVYKVLYGQESERAKEASACFGEAFREFPFSVKTLYKGPQNGGPSNLLYLNATGLDATMTCYSYDDLEHWFDREIYPFDVFVNQWSLMCKKWEAGLDLLKDIPLCDFVDVAGACYDIFKSSLNQILFVSARNQNDRGKMLKILSSEKECALDLYKIMLRNPCIGYEAANHYFYNRTQLLEKILNCANIAENLRKA